ncbi:MAG: transglutaminase-like domain-containing protein [Clostridiales bacterium]|jgi:hypothetical protein|nr:transglutaminase-like domain-containing protein [Clostridiales bacterium]
MSRKRLIITLTIAAGIIVIGLFAAVLHLSIFGSIINPRLVHAQEPVIIHAKIDRYYYIKPMQNPPKLEKIVLSGQEFDTFGKDFGKKLFTQIVDELSEPEPTFSLDPKSGYNIFATNSFSEYLALNMLNGPQLIDISEFDERLDPDALAAAVLEAHYQNPLILGIISFATNESKTTLSLEYGQSWVTRKRKQKELKQEAKRVIAEIITPGMSDLEKKDAINDYLYTTAQYNSAASEIIKEYGLKYTDSFYCDYFTAYGVLISKSGVCESFAAAFKLLADEAGLPCLVVSGYLFDNLPHAWNRVQIDGNWITVDPTNNNKLADVLFNVTDDIAQNVLVEDGRYRVPTQLSVNNFQNKNLDYYLVNKKYYTRDKITDMLIDALLRSGGATIRMDYDDLSDRQFEAIMNDVMAKGGYSSSDIVGDRWLGTIFISLAEKPITD